MPIITPKSPTKIEFKSLEDDIEKDNPVRLIDVLLKTRS